MRGPEYSVAVGALCGLGVVWVSFGALSALSLTGALGLLNS